MKIRAFVFEDYDPLRSVISSILESRRYEVLSYSEPVTCPIYLDRECRCPLEYMCGDIFIMENNMPSMTGLEFIENQTRNACKAIRKNKAVISGRWTDAELEQAKRLDCKIFEKPFKTNELLSWLDECERRIEPNRKLSDLPLPRNNA